MSDDIITLCYHMTYFINDNKIDIAANEHDKKYRFIIQPKHSEYIIFVNYCPQCGKKLPTKDIEIYQNLKGLLP